MRRFTLSPVASLTLSLLATLTVWLVFLSWRSLSERQDFVLPLLFLAVAMGLVGGLVRSLTSSGLWAVLATGSLTMLFVWLQISGQAGSTGSISTWVDAVEVARRSARTFQAPVPDSAPTIAPLLVIGGAMVLFCFDLVVSTLRQVTLGALLLLAAATIPVAVTGEAMGWGWFALVGLGYAGLLFGYQQAALQRWGRGTEVPVDATAATTSGNERRLAAPLTALSVAATAVAVAVVLPSTVPLPDSRVTGGAGWGTWGASNDDGPIEVSNPAADMRRDLNRGEDRPVLRVRTNDPDPSYLRLGTLNSFNGSEWTPGDRDVRRVAEGTFPPSAGYGAPQGQPSYDYTVQPLPLLRSDWLPAMPLTTEMVLPESVREAWTVDPTTLDVFHGGDDEVTTRDVDQYDFTARKPDWQPADLDGGGSGRGSVPNVFSKLPDNVPSMVKDLAEEVTAEARTPYERAQALQRWFRVDGGFTYSLDRAPAGSGNETLASFLAPSGRVGYCEQYSAAMAVMARELGIPSRVAVGWLTPELIEDGDGSSLYEYSSHDAHAWVEVYLPGAGWVSFEPTPSTRASRVPNWTEDSQNAPSPSPSTSASVSPSASATTSAPPSSLTPRPSASASATATTGQGEGSSSRILVWVLVALAAVLLLLALALAPRLVRLARRRRRFASGDPEDAWLELHDTATDLGLAPPVGRSLRETGTWYLDHLAGPSSTRSGATLVRGPNAAPAAAAEVEELVHALEARRYALVGGGGGSDVGPAWRWPEESLTALANGVTSSARTRAAWLPRSVQPRR